MTVNGHFPLGRLTLTDVVDEAASWPFDRGTAEITAAETIEGVRATANGLSLEPLATIVAARCEALLAGKPTGSLTAEFPNGKSRTKQGRRNRIPPQSIYRPAGGSAYVPNRLKMQADGEPSCRGPDD